MKTRKPFLLRIEPRLYEALEAWAQQEMRSVNGQIEYLLKQAVDKRLKLNSPVESGNIEPSNLESGSNAQPPESESTGETP